MVAKPILDILIGVEDINNVDDSLIRGLKEIGFLRLRVERPAEIIFAKFTEHIKKKLILSIWSNKGRALA